MSERCVGCQWHLSSYDLVDYCLLGVLKKDCKKAKTHMSKQSTIRALGAFERKACGDGQYEREQWAKMKPKRKRKTKVSPWPLESAEQKVFTKWLRDNGIKYFSVPNERSNTAEIGYAKSLGMKTGVPDLIMITLAPETRQPVAVEMKRVKEARPKTSDAQKETQAAMRDDGWIVFLAYGAKEAISQMQGIGYGKGLL